MTKQLAGSLIFFVTVSYVAFGAEVPPTGTEMGSVERTADKREIERLIEDSDRLRKERDAYRRDVDQADARVSAELKVLAAQLSKDIKEDFFASLTRLLWIMAILVGVATAGGFWKLSDLINKEIARKIDEKEQDIQKLRDQVMQALLDFKMEAANAIKEVSERRRTVQQETEAALTEIRSRRLEVSYVVDSSGKQFTALAPSELAITKKASRISGLPAGVTRIFSAGVNQGVYEALVEGSYVGVFSHFFQKALRDPTADTNGDGKVSLQEATLAARISLKAAGFDQDPEVLGSGASLALFSLRKISKAERLAGRVLAVLVGINEYAGGIWSLKGAVNDVSQFRELLEDRTHLLAAEVIVHVLTNELATYANVTKEIEWLRNTSSQEDIVLFYHSGHGTEIADTTRRHKRIPVLVLHDSTAEGGSFLRVPDLLNDLSRLAARERVFMTS